MGPVRARGLKLKLPRLAFWKSLNQQGGFPRVHFETTLTLGDCCSCDCGYYSDFWDDFWDDDSSLSCGIFGYDCVDPGSTCFEGQSLFHLLSRAVNANVLCCSSNMNCCRCRYTNPFHCPVWLLQVRPEILVPLRLSPP